jgi:ribonuclease P protein component
VARRRPVDILKRRSDFQRVRGGKRWATPHLLVEAKARPASSELAATPLVGARFGITITRKIGGAVVRNRVRRRLKAILSDCGASLSLPDHDYVIVARDSIAQAAFADIKASLETALQRIRSAPAGTSRSPPSGRRKQRD